MVSFTVTPLVRLTELRISVGTNYFSRSNSNQPTLSVKLSLFPTDLSEELSQVHSAYELLVHLGTARDDNRDDHEGED